MNTRQSSLYSLLALLTLALMLVGCAPASTTGAQTQPTATTVAQTQPTPTATSIPLPTCQANNIPTGGTTAEPTIVPNGWTTFTDTQLHYSIRYPSNWIIPNGPCPGASFDVFNHIPVAAAGGPAFSPGGFHIEVVPMPNPSQLSAAAFAQTARPNMPDGPPCAAAYTLAPIKVSGRDAVLATCPAGSTQGEGDPNQGENYFVPDGTTMLVIIQRDLINGQPSPILAQMVASITFTS
jgi:hypothetical protein